ncbi:aminotransferase class IV family protein [Aminobacter sp. AP02]|uniref:aminotransferase class IV family protein n=1 Tax=Aminobacter sp. AP02 TaxID=2135737 RepID=UPI000D6B5F8A|nr:aminotransferase class IV family protein [Aminobacter sp. AP02]PWK71701.1 4-amino-4-deoxychorismate lyase [Aminobacter sp. AP02]
MPSQSTLRHGHGAGFELIETMRWEPATGFLRGGLHLARLRASAKALGFTFDQGTVENALRLAVGGDTALRVRLALSADGSVDITTQAFTPLAPDTTWIVRIADTRLASSNPLLRHKTTRRDAYDRARAEFSREQADEVILLNEAGDVCEGTITNVFVDMGDGGPLKTPALACGLLAGVLRGEMIEGGMAVEAVVSAADFRRAAKIWFGNSLRGLIAANLAQ